MSLQSNSLKSKEEEKEDVSIKEDDILLAEQNVLGDENVLDEEEEKETKKKSYINGFSFNFNNVSAEKCIEYMMDLLYLQKNNYSRRGGRNGGNGRGERRRRRGGEGGRK